MTLPIYVTPHAHERACERLGWRGTAQALAALISSMRGVRAGLAVTRGQRMKWRFVCPDHDICVMFDGNLALTVYPARTRKRVWRDVQEDMT